MGSEGESISVILCWNSSVSGMPCHMDKRWLCGSWLKLGLRSSTAGKPILKLTDPLLVIPEAKLLLHSFRGVSSSSGQALGRRHIAAPLYTKAEPLSPAYPDLAVSMSASSPFPDKESWLKLLSSFYESP